MVMVRRDVRGGGTLHATAVAVPRLPEPETTDLLPIVGRELLVRRDGRDRVYNLGLTGMGIKRVDTRGDAGQTATELR